MRVVTCRALKKVVASKIAFDACTRDETRQLLTFGYVRNVRTVYSLHEICRVMCSQVVVVRCLGPADIEERAEDEIAVTGGGVYKEISAVWLGMRDFD